jgi:hypothetical protein
MYSTAFFSYSTRHLCSALTTTAQPVSQNTGSFTCVSTEEEGSVRTLCHQSRAV